MTISTGIIRRSGTRAAFTLTELLVAVLILVVVVLAAGRIFGTVGTVTRLGEANADILQTAVAVERQLRRDISSISTDGFLVIESISVPNDYHSATNAQAPLIDPSRGPNERIRSDRLLFFTHGFTPSQQYVGSAQLFFPPGAGVEQRIEDQGSLEARVQYGHGVQLGSRVRPRIDGFFFLDGEPLVPWSWDNPLDGSTGGRSLLLRAFPRSGSELPPAIPQLPPGTPSPPTVNGSQPPAPRWILARQQMLLADDGRSPFYHRANVLAPPGTGPASWRVPNSTAGIWPGTFANDYSLVASSRVDVASTSLSRIRRELLDLDGPYADIADRRLRMLGALVFPRAEAASQPVLIDEPTFGSPPHQISRAELVRLEQMLTAPTLAVGCSEFIVEWTWADGTGAVRFTDGSLQWPGVTVNTAVEQPWFGLATPERSVFPASAPAAVWPWNWGTLAGSAVFPENIESGFSLSGGIEVYQAVFGFNRSEALGTDGQPSQGLGFTPWPTALRITMTLNDQRGALERGRRFQFVVDLPNR